MHHLTCGQTGFNFNSDLSGDVVITKPDGSKLEVPGRDLVDFVAEQVRRARIAEVEEMSALRLLGLTQINRT